MIGRSCAVRSMNTQISAAPIFDAASVFGLAGFASPGLGSTACPTCGAPSQQVGSLQPSPSVGLGTAIAGSVVSMTLAGLATQFVAKRVLGW